MLDGEANPEQPQKLPRLVASRTGRTYSFNALLERIETQFAEEHGSGPAMSAALQAANTTGKRTRLLLDTVEYVLAVESIHLNDVEKAELVQIAYANLFTYGPLDALFLDERVTTIAVEGAERVSVRYGHGDLTMMDARFEDEAQVRQVVQRLLLDAGTELREDTPVMETGLVVGQRPVCVNLVAPPITMLLTLDIRVHPANAPTLDDLMTVNYLSEDAAAFLTRLAASEHGLVVVGDTESGKTTLLSVLAGLLPDAASTAAVERAGELRLPEPVKRWVAQWPRADQPGVQFGEQLVNALAARPSTLLLDEVRADAAELLAPLLSDAQAPRQWWSFRGAVDAKRLQNALGMLARRAAPAAGEAVVHALYQRLPFVLTTRRWQGRLQLYSIAEWQANPTSEYADLVPLFNRVEGELVQSGRAPQRSV